MQILYLYDIKAKNKREFNRVKRSFYYHLAKLNLPRNAFRTKSALFVSERFEQSLDALFARFKDSLEVYKATIEHMEML